MITILASLAGFISSLLPDLIRLFNDRNDKKHELEILKLQIQQNQSSRASKLQEISNIADIIDSKILYSSYNTGVTWVDALNGTVRPVLAYSFFALYSLAKYLQIKLFSSLNILLDNYDLIWSPEDQAIFAGIISFYYGQRAISKLRKTN